MHPFFFISQIFRSVSDEPDAKNSPNGWNSTEVQLDLCPVRDRTTASRFKNFNQIFIFPKAWHYPSTRSLKLPHMVKLEVVDLQA
jgi:hypothetical protein